MKLFLIRKRENKKKKNEFHESNPIFETKDKISQGKQVIANILYSKQLLKYYSLASAKKHGIYKMNIKMPYQTKEMY